MASKTPEQPAYRVRHTHVAALLSFFLGWVGSDHWVSGQSYFNVAPEQGLDITTDHEGYGNGVSFYDIDQDGWDDLTFAMKDDSLVIFLNNEGTLVQQPSPLYLPGETKHVLWVDYDNDGDLDLLVTTRGGTYRLYRNDGSLNFTHVSLEAGLTQANEETYGASWADYDRDGDLDLYVCIYEYEGDESMFTRVNHLYRNNGDGTFTDVTIEAGVANGIKTTFLSIWFDYDHDGWPDLYVVNDRAPFDNALYRNNGDGTFTDVTLAAGVASTGYPMTGTVGDFDNDGDLDIYMTNIGGMWRAMLLVNNGDGTFTQSGQAYGVDIDLYSWGGLWVDHDNNGWQDLYVATAFPIHQALPNRFFINGQGGPFTPGENLFLGNNLKPSYAVARGDLNNDGAYDIVQHNVVPHPPDLWLNSGGANNHIKLTLRGTTSNRMAIGSWIRVYANGICQTQYTHCGENYMGQNSQHHIFGIGQAMMVDSVQVEYPLGHTDTFYSLAANTNYLLTEGDTYTATIDVVGNKVFCHGDSVVLDGGEHAGHVWNTGTTDRFHTVTASGSYWVVVTNEFGVTANSDTVVVTVHPTPVIEATTQNPLCSGEATGSISLENLTGVLPALVQWQHGAIGPALGALTAGEYTYTYTDINGCTSSGTLELVDPPPMFIDVSTTPANDGENGSVTIAAFGGVPPYTATLNGIAAALINTGLAPGAYMVMVTDQYGCTLEQSVIVDDVTGMEEDGTRWFQFYPNPAYHQINIVSERPLSIIQVVGMDGGIVMHRDGFFPSSVPFGSDIQHLAPGTYILRACDTKGHWGRALLMKWNHSVVAPAP